MVAEKFSQEILNVLNSLASRNSYRIHEIPYKRKYIAFVNPIGGMGKAEETLAVVQEMFTKSYINVNVIRTQHHNHAYEIVSKLDRNEV